MTDESKIDLAKKMQEGKKPAIAYLKAKVEDHDRILGQNFAKGNYALAAHDARSMAALLDVLGQLSLSD